MKILYYDCFSGISGDMNLGAMLDLGVDKTYLLGELNKLNLKGWELEAVEDQRHGIRGTRVTVRQTTHEHTHRHLSDIKKIVNDSGLSEKDKSLTLKIFSKLAEAEAEVHGLPVDKIHFHEVGAIDSIIDIAGAAICFNALDVDAVHVSEIELGGGTVTCDHGKLPVPAPATAELTKNIPVKTGGTNFEATTPTGAAILATLGTSFGRQASFVISKTGYGIGQKENPEMPNVLRVFLGETADSLSSGHIATLIECNIDDMNPEFYDYISEKLFSAGASDVCCSSIIMKKGRPGIKLSVICENGLAGVIRDIIFTESTTLGLRIFTFQKETLERRFEILDTIYGNVTVKRSFYKGKEVSHKPEYDDCKRIAIEKGIPVKEVYHNLMAILDRTKENKK